MTDKSALQKGSQMLIYQSEDGHTKIEVQLEAESVWLPQKQMADLFQTSKQNAGQHLKNIFAEGELDENSVVKKFFTTAADGKFVGWIKRSESTENYYLSFFIVPTRAWGFVIRLKLVAAGGK